MSEETNEPEDNQIEEIPRMSDDEIREFTDALLSGQVFTSGQAPEELLGTIFMPLMMGAAAHLEPVIENVGCFYEYIEKAGPRAINGYPIFSSFHIMNKDDWDIVMETYKYERVRRDTMPVIRKPEKRPDVSEEVPMPEVVVRKDSEGSGVK